MLKSRSQLPVKIAILSIILPLLFLTGCINNQIRPDDSTAIYLGARMIKPMTERTSITVEYHRTSSDASETLSDDQSVSFPDSGTVYGGSRLDYDYRIERASLRYQYALVKYEKAAFLITPYYAWSILDLSTYDSNEKIYEIHEEQSNLGLDFALMFKLNERTKLIGNLGGEIFSHNNITEVGLKFEYAMPSGFGVYGGWHRLKFYGFDEDYDMPTLELTSIGLLVGALYTF